MESYAAGFVTGLGAGAAGIWMALGHTPLAAAAGAVAIVGIVFGISARARERRHVG